MGAVTPEWLNASFVQKVLKNSENDESIEVKGVTTKPATAKGDNYTSDMIRVRVEYSRNGNGRREMKDKSLIVKIAPTAEGVQKEMITKIGLFDTEIIMMETTLKEMNRLVNEDNYRLGANVLFTEVGDPSLLVIEDLAPLGYRMADRQSGLDLQHCILAMRGLGKFHGSSVAVCEKEPKHTLSFGKGMFNKEHPEELQRFFVEGLKSLGKEVATWKELGPIYAEKITKLSGVGYGKAADSATRNEEEFNVINHGDFWVNNMLFRYNDQGKVTDHIFVDFQLCVYTSPAVDLLYFLNTSPSAEVNLYHREALLDEYLSTLKRTMSKLNCKTKPPSMTALKKSMEEREFYGVISASTILPIVLVDKSEAKTLDEMLQMDGGYDNPGYRSQPFRKVMLEKMPEWNSRGLLDA